MTSVFALVLRCWEYFPEPTTGVTERRGPQPSADNYQWQGSACSQHMGFEVCVHFVCWWGRWGTIDGSQTKQQIVSWGVSNSCQVLYTKRHRYSTHNEVTRGLYCQLFEASANTSYRDLGLIQFFWCYKATRYFLRISTAACCKILSTRILLLTVQVFDTPLYLRNISRKKKKKKKWFEWNNTDSKSLSGFHESRVQVVGKEKTGKVCGMHIF